MFNWKVFTFLSILFTLSTLSAQYYCQDDCYDQFCNPCDGWYLQGDLLYWKIRRSELDYAIDNYDERTNPSEFRPYGDIRCVDLDYDLGVRVRLSKECRDFYAAIEWTNYDTKKSSSIFAGDDNPIYLPTRLHPAVEGFDAGNYAEGIYDYRMNQIDLEFGVSYHVNQCQKIQPYVGFRYTRIDQELEAVITNNAIGWSSDNFQRLDAFALAFGTRGIARFCDCFELFVKVGGALHLADFDTNRNLYPIVDSIKFDTDPQLSSRKKECLWIANTDLAFGLGFDVCKQQCAEIKIQIGYEIHKWFCLPDFLNFTDDHRSGSLSRNQQNLGYDGLFAGLRVSF